MSSTCVLLLNSIFGQQSKIASQHTIHSRVIKDDSIKLFIDSIKSTILAVTSKFNREDLTNANGRTGNKNSYSLLFLVDLKYSYRLDIINGTLVAEFVNEILDPLKIDIINILDQKESQSLFGYQGHNGAVLISTKKKSKYNYKVGGLKYDKKRKRGNNFDQRQPGEIIIRT